MNPRHTVVAMSAAVTLAVSPAHAGELHVFTSGAAGFHTHSYWYDDGKEVTVVDTQFTPAIAEALVQEIRSRTKSPITRVIVTHPNPDKFNALSVFHRLGAESFASADTAAAMPGVDAYKRYFWTKIAKAFTDETYPKVEPVKTTFTGRRTITLASGETLTLIALEGPGVSSAQSVVRIDSSGDLLVGDLVAHEAHAWLEGGIVGGKATPALDGWKRTLRQLPALGTGKLYGGRGGSGPVAEVVARQLAYLEKADAIVTAYVKRLGRNGAAALNDPAKAPSHHAAIQAELASAFPGYAHPELVGYGVYGLAQSKLASSEK